MSTQPVITFDGEDGLFRAVHPRWIQEDGLIAPGAFQNNSRPVPTNQMSVGAEQLAAPEQVLAQFPWSDEGCVARITAGTCWDLEQTVEHSPIAAFAAHSDVVGEKDDLVRLKFADACERVDPVRAYDAGEMSDDEDGQS